MWMGMGQRGKLYANAIKKAGTENKEKSAGVGALYPSAASPPAPKDLIIFLRVRGWGVSEDLPPGLPSPQTPTNV